MKIASCLTFCVGPKALAADQPSLLANGSFDAGLESWSVSGGGTEGGGRPSVKVLAGAALDGTTVLQIQRPDSAPASVIEQLVPGSALKSGARYRLETWVQAEALSKPGAAVFAGEEKSPLPEGSFNWQKIHVDFTAPADPESSPGLRVGLEVSGSVKRLWTSRFTLAEIPDASSEVASLLESSRARLARIEARLAEHPDFAQDSYLQADLEIARRFIERVATNGPGGTQGFTKLQPDDPEIMRWSLLQARETVSVLQRTDARLERLIAGTAAPWTMPSLAGKSLVLSPAGFQARGDDGTMFPVVLGGYLHFGKAWEDAEFLSRIGMNLFQQEAGPRDLNRNGSFSHTAVNLLEHLREASPDGRYLDILLSPHYMDNRLYKEHPDFVGNEHGGFIKYNIDHPLARSSIEDWLNRYVPAVLKAGGPGHFAFCLSNEPTYRGSGRDPHSLPLWKAWLEQKHSSIEALNAAYRQKPGYKSFSEVPVPPAGYPHDPVKLPAYYDWVRFNQEHFASWHRWMHDTVKSAADGSGFDPENVWTHAKLIPDVFDARPLEARSMGGMPANGMDPELVALFTDLAGCDSWNSAASSDLACPWERNWANSWVRTHMWYDLLNSFNGRPVMDSELHYIRDGSPAESIPPEFSHTVLWQGALHNRTAFAIWLWTEPLGGRDFAGSVTMRPANIQATSHALMDLNRLAKEVAAINSTPARIALLYSPTSQIWQENYNPTSRAIYAILSGLGHKVTFVSEKQLAANKLPSGLDLLFLPQTTHVLKSTVEAIPRLLKTGIAVIPVGGKNLRYDEYGRLQPAAADRGLGDEVKLSPDNPGDSRSDIAALVAASLAKRGSSLPLALVEKQTQLPPWGIEYRDTNVEGRRLISLANMTKDAMNLTLETKSKGTDLLTGLPVDLTDFQLPSLGTLLVELSDSATPGPSAGRQAP